MFRKRWSRSAAGVEAVGTRAPREVLAVATDFAFAAYWLMPRLARFYQLNPQVDVSLITSNRPLVALGGDVDLAIAFGDGRVRRGESQLLFYGRSVSGLQPAATGGPGPQSRSRSGWFAAAATQGGAGTALV